MNRILKRVKLYVKDTPKAYLVKDLVTEELKNNGFIIDDINYDIAISLGGDGTFLKMLHSNHFNTNIYYASINAGSLGFLSSIESSEIESFIKEINNNSFKVKELDLLSTKVFSDNIKEYLSINELTIRKNNFSSLRCEVFIDNSLLENYVGDGLVISTTNGSTGYNLALFGPIIDTSIKAYCLATIAPIKNRVYKTLSNAIVLSNDRILTIVTHNSDNLCVLSDGKLTNINNIRKIECRIVNDTIKCIIPSKYNYIENIKSKMIDVI